MEVLANAVLVGGNPAAQETYAYMAWKGDRGILSVRNPGPDASEITIPFDATTWYRGEPGKAFRAQVVYPYQGEWPASMTSGTPIRIQVPGYSLLVFQLEPGAATGSEEASAPPVFTRVRDEGAWSIRGSLPDESMQRCELFLISRTNVPNVFLNETQVAPARTNGGRGWLVSTFDLREFRGKEVHLSVQSLAADNPTAWLIMDRPVSSRPPDQDPRLPTPVSHGFRRQTQLLTVGTE
jgi:hypothetical protein